MKNPQNKLYTLFFIYPFRLADEEEEVKNIKESDIFATTTTTTTVVPGVLPLLFG